MSKSDLPGFSQAAEAVLDEAFGAARDAEKTAIEGLAGTPLGTWENPWGTADVTIYPARGPVVAALKKRNIGGRAREGGYRLSFGADAMVAANASAKAFADVLTRYGLRAYSSSQLD